MDKFNFRDFAQKAQQAGTKLAAQVKEQQQKFAAAQKSQDGTAIATTSFHQEEFASETENALRLVQIQNKALRDRLRSAADENERLKDQVHQLTSNSTTRGNAHDLITQPDGGAEANSATSPRLAAVVAENEQLREEIAELKDLVRRAEEHAEIADAANQQVKSLQAELVKEREQAIQAAAAAAGAVAAAENNAASSSSSQEQELISLQQALEKMRGDMGVAVAAREAAEAASQQAQEEIHTLMATVSTLKSAQASTEEAASTAAAETQAVLQASEQLHNEIAFLQADLEALKQQIDCENKEKNQQNKHVENLQRQLEDVIAAREAATAAAAAMEEEFATTQASVASSSEDSLRRIAELEAEVELLKMTGATAVEEESKKEFEKAQARYAAALTELKTELEKQHNLEIEALQDEIAQQTALAAAAATASARALEQHTCNTEAATAAAISSATEALESKIEALEATLREKEAQLEPLQQDLEAAQSGRAAALEELRTELEAQHAQHASQVDSLQEQFTRLRTEHAEEVDALREETAALETQLKEAKAATVAATEASGEEAVWLREGAQELQRQLDATRVESETAMKALQAELNSFKEQLLVAETAAAATEAEAKSTAAKATEELAALQAEVERMRGNLQVAEQEVASLKTEAATMREEKTTLTHKIAELELEATTAAAAALNATPQSPPPPSYDVLQMQDQIDALRAENAVALQEAAIAAERALVSEAARQEATEQFTALTTAAAEESFRLRADVEVAHQRVAELEASLAIAAAATTIPAQTAGAETFQHQQSGERQSVIERAGSGISAATVSPPLSPGSMSGTGGIAGLGSVPLVPHHRRDPSYSSEIEPAAGTDTGEEQQVVAIEGEARTATSPTTSGLPPLPPSVPLAPLAPIILNAGASLEEQIRVLEAELTDSERTHALRDTATAVLKDEIAELRRQQKRAEVDIDYLKAVLVESFASGELNSRSHMLPVLARLLQFSPKDMERALAGKTAVAPGGDALSSASAAASALFTRWSATTPAGPST